MKPSYWIMFERDREPRRFVWAHVAEMLEDLPRLMLERGAIEWMQRDYGR